MPPISKKPAAPKSNASQHQINETAQALRELDRRKQEALNLYRPLPFQERFHACRAKQCVILKGNQVGGPQKFDEPVLMSSGSWKRICDLQIGDMVVGSDGLPCSVTGVQDVGILPVMKIHFDDDAVAFCALNHPWKCQMTKTERFKSHEYYKPDKWGVRTLLEIIRHGGADPEPRDRAVTPVCVAQFNRVQVPIDPYVLGALIGDGSFAHGTIEFTTGDKEIADEVSLLLSGIANVVSRGSSGVSYGVSSIKEAGKPRVNAVTEGLRQLGLAGCRGELKFIPECYKFNSLDVRMAIIQGLMDTDGHVNKNGVTHFYTSSPRLAQDMADVVRSLGGKAKIKWRMTEVRATKAKRKGKPRIPQACPNLFSNECLNMAVVWIRIPGMCPFRLPRKIERWKNHREEETAGRIMVKIEPHGNERCVCIQVDSPDHTYVTRDYVVTHNSLAGFVEVARAATGRDPHNKYPKENGTAVCLGYGEKHIGRVIHKYLFRAGAFRMIRDEKTRDWRVYRPWEPGEIRMGLPGDLHREEDAKLSSPLIPNRLIKSISWDKRSEYIFSRVELKNGWQILAFNTAGEAAQAQGFQAHLIEIDEDTASPGWLPEMLQRTVHTKGLLRWTALPHMKNDEMVGIIEQAEMQVGEPEPTAVMIQATAYDNEYYPKDELKKSERILKSQGEDMYRRRMLGEIVLDSILMYPSFNKRIHCAVRKEKPKSRVQEILEEMQGIPPRDWCRYMVIDPGHTVCAVNFFAVPPPAIGDQIVAYDELYLRNCEETMLAREVKKKVNDFLFQEFIIDMHGGRLRELGSGELPMFRYARKFEEFGIKSQGTGFGFRAGSDDVVKRVGELRSWLHIRGDGTTKFLILVDRCPNTVGEFGRYRKKIVRVNGLDTPLDEGERRNIHAIDNLEYAAAHGLRYVKPPAASTAVSKAVQIYRDTMKRLSRSRAGSADGGISLGVD